MSLLFLCCLGLFRLSEFSGPCFRCAGDDGEGMMLGRRELGPMDWEREEQRIRDRAALESESISAIVNAPTEHLAAIVAAVEPGGMCWFCRES